MDIDTLALTLCIFSYSGLIMDYSEELAETIESYHGVLSHGTAMRRLLTKDEFGFYLLRKPRENHNEYVLSYIDKSKNLKSFIIPSQRRNNLFVKNPNLNSLVDVFGFIIDKFKSGDSQLLFQLNSDDVLNDDNLEDEQGQDIFPCHVCHESFGSAKQLQNHGDSHRIHYCHHCEQVIPKNSVKSHTPSCRNREVQESFECDRCNFTSRHRRSMERHLQFHKHDHVCDLCKTSFKTDKLLQSHLFKSHSKGVPCLLCDKIFESSNKRDIHVKNTHDPKGHSCQECQKQFRFQCDLRRHEETHQKTRTNHPPPPPPTPTIHNCDHCSYKSGKKSNFLRHVRNFHQERRPVVIPSLKIWEIMSRRLMSMTTILDLTKQIRDIIGKEHFEANLEETLRSCLNSFREDFEAEIVTFLDSKNKKIKSTLGKTSKKMKHLEFSIYCPPPKKNTYSNVYHLKQFWDFLSFYHCKTTNTKGNK